ncbi:hypothetical protein [Shewanella atlantica]|uniref:hypothetical protein n=1 Tax=Shewanella atlantica TaxID=271099 RepID=UPI003736673D
MKSIFLSLMFSISFATLSVAMSACANDPRPGMITIEDSGSLTTIKVYGALPEKELHFNSEQYEINFQNLGDNLFHIDAKITSVRVDNMTGEELVSSNQIVSQVRAEPGERITIGGLDSWSESVREDGRTVGVHSQKQYVLEIVK